MPTPIGARNARVQVLQPVVVNGVQTWNTPASIVATAWAFINEVSGAEQAQGLAPPTALMSNVSLPYRVAAMRPRMRLAVVGTTRVLEIDAAVNDSSRNIEWALTCREVAS